MARRVSVPPCRADLPSRVKELARDEIQVSRRTLKEEISRCISCLLR
jgi:hypothetical protein